MSGYFINFVNYIWNLFKWTKEANQEKTPIHSSPPRGLDSVSEDSSVEDDARRSFRVKPSLDPPEAKEQNSSAGIAFNVMIIPPNLDYLKDENINQSEINLNLSMQDTPLSRPVCAMFPQTGSPRPERSRTDHLHLRRCYSLDLIPYLQNNRAIKVNPSYRARKFERPTTAPKEDTYINSPLVSEQAIEGTTELRNSPLLLTPPRDKEQRPISQYFTPPKSKYFAPPKSRHPTPKESRIPICSARRHSLGSTKRAIKTPIITPGRFQHTCCGGKRDRRHSGHTMTHNTIPAAHRIFLDCRLDEMFRQMSKKKYCGNIIDSASHCRWMRLAGIYQDKDAQCFKRYAKGRVVLTVNEYKIALHKMCQEHNLDYWEVLRKMACVTPENDGDCSTKYKWNESVNCK